MSPRKTNSKASPPPEDPVLRVPRDAFTTELNERIALGEELVGRPVQNGADYETYKRDFRVWNDVNERILQARFTDASVAKAYPIRHFVFVPQTPAQEIQERREEVRTYIGKLESICAQVPYYDAPESTEPPITRPSDETGSEMIFLVHGHDGERKLEVAGFLERVIGVRPTILHEQANSGRTIIEKFEAHAARTKFAVVLLTADDEGGPKGGPVQPRARQNVIFELGFFMGALGRGHVVALLDEGVEKPSDIDGVLYLPLSGSWQFDLAKELSAAHIDVDLNKA